MERSEFAKALDNGEQYTVDLEGHEYHISGKESMQDRIDMLTIALYQASDLLTNIYQRDSIAEDWTPKSKISLTLKNIEHVLDDVEMFFAERGC